MSHAKTLILIVDDEEIVREALEGWLEKDGYTLSVALDNLDRRDRQLVSGARRSGSSPRARLSRLETPGAAAHPAGMD
jgi:CheY-like chemotaxis protein